MHDLETIKRLNAEKQPGKATETSQPYNPPSLDTADKTERMLNAYKKAFNRVDDLMEYQGMSKPQFDAIAKSLLNELLGIAGVSTRTNVV